jgi:hypothetical protein
MITIAISSIPYAMIFTHNTITPGTMITIRNMSTSEERLGSYWNDVQAFVVARFQFFASPNTVEKLHQTH